MILYKIIRFFCYPLIAGLLPLFNKKALMRKQFEKKSYMAYRKSQKADIAFEVSSEGELEQVLYLVKDYLKQNKRIELLYCSASVEHKCQNLQKQFPDQIDLLRFPLLLYSPFKKTYNIASWMTAPVLILCRYDFFPELIELSKNKRLILLSAIAVNFKDKSHFAKVYLKYCYGKFDKIICATPQDKEVFTNHIKISHNRVNYFDFRLMTIHERLKKSKKTMTEIFPGIYYLLETFSNQKKVVLGSFWSHEGDLLKNMPEFFKKMCFCLAPHDLGKKSINEITSVLTSLGIKVYEVNEVTSLDKIKEIVALHEKSPGVFLINLKGILCELYSLFDFAYVGGGFGESVHSLLEPYLAGCYVICGPKTHRSTEYLSIKTWDEKSLYRLNDMSEFNSLVKSLNEKELNHNRTIDLPLREDYNEIVQFLAV